MTDAPKRAFALAELLAEAHAHRTRVALPAELEPRSAEEAYAVQDLLYARLCAGKRSAAWKVGATSDPAVRTAAPILEVLASPARVAGSRARLIGVEAEVAYRLASDLPARATDYAEEEIAAAVAEVLVAIELCDARIADWERASVPHKLADFVFNAALVTGSGIADWREVDFPLQSAELWLDGVRRVDVLGAHPCGNPFRLLPWLVTHCARRSGGLRAGDVITTGSWGGMHPVAPGQTVIARFPGIGEASVSIGSS